MTDATANMSAELRAEELGSASEKYTARVTSPDGRRPSPDEGI